MQVIKCIPVRHQSGRSAAHHTRAAMCRSTRRRDVPISLGSWIETTPKVSRENRGNRAPPRGKQAAVEHADQDGDAP